MKVVISGLVVLYMTAVTRNAQPPKEKTAKISTAYQLHNVSISKILFMGQII
jgi:hypothetical protein